MKRFRVVGIARGANPYSSRSVVLAEVSPPAASGASPESAGRLRELIDSAQPAYVEERLGRLAALDAPGAKASPGELIAHAALALQRWAGYPVHRYATRHATAPTGVQPIAYEFCSLRIALAAGKLAAELAGAAADHAARKRARGLLERFAAKYAKKLPSHVSFILECEARGVPWQFMPDGAEFLVLGQGSRQRRMWRHFTGATSHIATVLSTHKDAANAVFRAHGLPVPRQQPVRSADEAAAALRALGAPVVVKPAAQDYGIGVHVGLAGEDEVRAAYASASKHGPVLVEEQIPGDQHRMMILEGRLSSVRRQVPAHVRGDGTRTVRALVEATNRERVANGWQPVPLDEEARALLERQGLSPGSVPQAGRQVGLRTQANLSTGGSMEVLTERVHPDNAALALRAAAVMGFDIAGLDFITTDITRSFMDVGGAICEINATPGFILGEEGELLDRWFAAGDRGRIPVIGVLDPDPAGHVARCAAQILGRYNAPVGTATRGGLSLGGSVLARGDFADAAGARAAILQPGAAGAVVELTSQEFARAGAGVDRYSVLLVVPVAAGAGPACEEQQRALNVLTLLADVCLTGQDERADPACPVCRENVPPAHAVLLRELDAALGGFQDRAARNPGLRFS